MPLIASAQWNPAKPLDTRHPWNRQELLDAFTQLSMQIITSSRFHIFVDGLDEYAGEHADIISVLSSLASSKPSEPVYQAVPGTLSRMPSGRVLIGSYYFMTSTRQILSFM